MIGFELGGGALAGLCVVTVAVVIVAWLILRIVGRDHLIRVARIGVFVERQRVGEPGEPAELWTPDPLAPSRGQEMRPVPIPPPTPPPPLPPDDETQTWPKREESP